MSTTSLPSRVTQAKELQRRSRPSTTSRPNSWSTSRKRSSSFGDSRTPPRRTGR
ncbi:hypothetical protein ACFQIA_16335 [Halalkalicoccus sp. GCM10025704]